MNKIVEIINKVGKSFSFLAMERQFYSIGGPWSLVSLTKDQVGKSFSQEDLLNIQLGGRWFLFKHYLAIQQWKPKFQALKGIIDSMAIWVQIPELTVEFFLPFCTVQNRFSLRKTNQSGLVHNAGKKR